MYGFWNQKAPWITPGVLMLMLLVWRCASSPGEFASLDPQNRYMGNQSCQPCHKKIYASYLETGMGHSMYRPQPREAIEDFGPKAVVFDSSRNFFYHPFWRADTMFIEEFRLRGNDTIYQRVERVDYVIGSGHQTRSYLMQRNGYLFEIPITWYVSKGIWDLSPGYHGNNSRFDREIGQECLACHTGAFDYIAGSKNRYRKIDLGIDCERCHGPGEQHIRATENGQLIDVGVETDYTIVNPDKLPIDQQFDVCQQCHLQGVNVFKDDHEIRDYRPAMDLTKVRDIFIAQDPNADAFGIASHAERLQQSRCFIASAGKLNCTTCHDPHRSIAVTDPQIYVRQCQSCHQDGHELMCGADAQLMATEEGNCIACHMPSGGTSDIPHVSFHDHKIRVVDLDRQPEPNLPLTDVQAISDLVCATDSAPGKITRGKAWLRWFEEQDANTDFLEKALLLLDESAPYDMARARSYQGQLAEARRLTQKALKNDPDEPLIRFLLGEIQEAQNQPAAAAQTFLSLYREHKEVAEAGFKGATNLLKARPGDTQALAEAKGIFEELLAKRPFDVRILSNLGFVALNQGDPRRARWFLDRALELDPDYEPAKSNLKFILTQ